MFVKGGTGLYACSSDVFSYNLPRIILPTYQEINLVDDVMLLKMFSLNICLDIFVQPSWPKPELVHAYKLGYGVSV